MNRALKITEEEQDGDDLEDMDPEEREALLQALKIAQEEANRGEFVEADEVMAELSRRRHEWLARHR